jgi:hypothetical protein
MNMVNETKTEKKYFGWQHLRLLSIATWAKNLSWIAIVAYILLASGQVLQILNSATYRAQINGPSLDGLMFYLNHNPLELVKLGVSTTATIFQGVATFLVLRGIYLGLNMIVETDINYRDQSEEGEQ